MNRPEHPTELDEFDCAFLCPVKKVGQLLEGKWTTLILRELLSGKKRYFELRNALEGVSPKVLASRLRMLEVEGIIAREMIDTVPPSTRYELTDLGCQVKPLLEAMAVFGTALIQAQAAGQ